MRRRLLTLATALATAFALAAPTAGAAGSAQPSDPAPDEIVVQRFTTISPFENGGTIGDPAPGSVVTEIQKPKRIGGNPLRSAPGSGTTVGLSPGTGHHTPPTRRSKGNPKLVLSFEGVSHRDSRLAFDGNQFSGEPADQGLCVGNGYILETVNSALRVFQASSGAPVTDVIALNELYGFPPAIDRTNFIFGPFTFDISCHYDPDSQTWFHLAVDLEQDPVTGAFTGRNYLDLAVSTSADPTGSWNVYRIPGMNDGTEGTPDHNCSPDTNGDPELDQCFADFPHIGVDENGVYISTNEFDLFGPNFIGAQVYAISKADLVAGADEITAFLFDTSQAPWAISTSQPGFTVWPALSAGTQFAKARGGTEYFVSSNAVFDDDNGDSEEIIVWALSGTGSLDDSGANLSLTRRVIPSQRYAIPPESEQKPGITPLLDCLNDASGAFFGTNCGEVFGIAPPANEDLGPIDTGDSRIMDVRYAKGQLYAVLGTAVSVRGEQLTGVGWFILDPRVGSSGVSATIDLQGILAVRHESLAYPTIGITTKGTGAMGFTRVGANLFPSQGYVALNRQSGVVGKVRMYGQGRSPQDGFTEYSVFTNRPRWGDYSAAAVQGNTVYLSGQYIQQGPCDLTEFINTGFQCDDLSRSSFANWTTRVGAVKP